MKSLLEEIILYDNSSTYCINLKRDNKKRLEEFLEYLSKVTDTPEEDIHLEKIYETIDYNGKTLFFSPLDVKLVEEYLKSHLYKSYNWLHQTRRALQSFFHSLNRKYDFPLLIDEMTFVIEEHKCKPEKKEKYVLSRHDLLKFLQSLLKNSMNLERDAIYFLLLITTGSRPSEILNVKVRDIDLINETIYLEKTKNNSSKFIVLRDGFGIILKRYIEKHRLNVEDYLVNNSGEKILLADVQYLFDHYLDCAKLPRTTLHKLRHSFATFMAENDTDVLIIQQLLGHKKLHSTHSYINPNMIRNLGMELKVNNEVYEHIKKLDNFG
ncbi:site-specific integrase [Sutcliffiella horikoshii]|uniref:Site-specific integrase n=1 Tax=Sutcliffiella horikoshii TaxID=79883 RepID=A0A5D4TAB1_9BACI|nr:site-specific integrase [Sutcliffiella horikoshii]TYS71044.1 site-specific integrase [Sutcliffiella horikoshii]